MNPRIIAISFAVALPTLASTACLSSSKDNSLSKVDDLLTRIEKVHLSSEVARERMHTSVDTLHSIVGAEYGGDIITAYEVFVESIEASEKQADTMRKNIDGMRRAADRVFDKWAADLETISSTDLRRRSQARLTETRKNYEEIAVAAQPAQSALDVLNQGLRDHAVFLAHDLNATSVSDIQDGVRDLTDLAEELDGLLANCLTAAQKYVQNTAPPGEVDRMREDAPASRAIRVEQPRGEATVESLDGDRPSSGTSRRTNSDG